MKQLLSILTLLAFLVSPSIALAERGSDDDKDRSSTEEVERSNDDQDEIEDEHGDEVEDESEDELEGSDRGKFEIKRDDNRGPGKGLFDFLKPSSSGPGPAPMPALLNEKRDEFRDESKEDRDALRLIRKDQEGNLKQSRSELEALIKQKREALKAEITQIKKEKVTVRKAFVETHFTAAIDNLTNFSGRLQTKIDELEGKGFDMTSAQEHLDLAGKSLDLAEKTFADLKAMAVSDADETTATKARELAKKVEEYLKQTRDHFRESIKAIKASIGESDDDKNDDTPTATTAQ